MRISDWSSDVCSSDLPPSAVRYHVRGCVRGNALAPEGAARTDEGGTGVGRHMSESVRRMNMIEAINSAMDVAMERDPMVTVLGEDVGYFGGVFCATAGLQQKDGKTTVFYAPITQCGIEGVAGVPAALCSCASSQAH